MDGVKPAAPSNRPALRVKTTEEFLHATMGYLDDMKPPEPAPPANAPKTEYAVIPFGRMDDFVNHPFSLYSGERKSDMVDSIREKGVLQPLILRPLEGTDRYQILSGHNRKYSAIEAGLTEAPVIIKHGLSDEEAMIYVIETNLMQRSFTDMAHSEKAAVLGFEHSKLFSQGKRNDIKNELEMLEKSLNGGENSTSAQVGRKLESREKVGNEYSLSKNTVARYLRINHLNHFIKQSLNDGNLGLTIAVELSYLKPNEQDMLAKCMELNDFKVDAKKADLLRSFSTRGKLDEDKTYLILNGELAAPKKSRGSKLSLNTKFLKSHGIDHLNDKERVEHIGRALEFYHEHAPEFNALGVDDAENEDEEDMEL